MRIANNRVVHGDPDGFARLGPELPVALATRRLYFRKRHVAQLLVLKSKHPAKGGIRPPDALVLFDEQDAAGTFFKYLPELFFTIAQRFFSPAPLVDVPLDGDGCKDQQHEQYPGAERGNPAR